MKKYKSYFLFFAIFLSLLILLESIFFLSQILLSSPQKDAEKIAKKCIQGKENCYVKEFTTLTEKTNLDYATQTLLLLQKISPATRGCHLIAHSISLAEVKKDPTKWENILATINTSICSQGFMHGVFEAHLRQNPNFSLNKSSIPQLCSLIRKNDSTSNEANCSHIMGHLLLVQEKGDIGKSIQICNSLSDTIPEFKNQCFNGVFMENETRENLSIHGIKSMIQWNNENTIIQENICKQYEGAIGKACWTELAHMYVLLNQGVPKNIYNSCKKSLTDEYADSCYNHAMSIVVTAEEFSPSSMKLVCEPYIYNSQERARCVDLGIKALIYSSLEYVDKVIALCESETDKKTCYQDLGKTLKYISTSEANKIQICKMPPQDYYNDCYSSL